MSDVIFVPTNKIPSPLKPDLKARLEKRVDRFSGSEIERRLGAAEKRKHALIHAQVERSRAEVEKAKRICRQTKDKREADRVALAHAVEAKLAAADERRVAARSPQSSYNASPTSSLSISLDASLNASANTSFVASPRTPTAPKGPADATMRLPVSVADDPSPKPMDESEPAHQRLRRELTEVTAAGTAEGVLALVEWMKHPDTIDLAAAFLADSGVEPTLPHAKKLLGLVYLAHDKELLGAPAGNAAEGAGAEGAEGAEGAGAAAGRDHDDQVMAREARRFKKALRRQLRRAGAAAPEGEEPFAASFTRAVRFHAAWAQKDKLKLARQADEVLADLERRIMAVRARQAAAGAPAEPPEGLLAQVKALGGDEREAAARARFLRNWEAVAPAAPRAGGVAPTREAAMVGGLEAQVRAVAQRALFDAVGAQVRAGDYGALWGLLGELQGAMLALLAHDAARRDELADRFDAAFLQQQAEHGALETADVHALMRYVVATVVGWQAAADAAEAQSWAEQTAATLQATAGLPLPDFIAEHMVPFLASAIERVGVVYQRLMQFAEERDAQRAAAASAGA